MEEKNITVEPMSMMSQLQLLSIKEVCRYLGVGPWMVYKLINEGKLVSITIGTRRLVPVQAVQDFINNSKEMVYG